MPTNRELTAETKYRLLLQISRATSGTLDLGQILNEILDTVRSVLDYDAAGIFVVNRAVLHGPRTRPEQVIAGMAARGFDPRPPHEHDPMLFRGKGIIGHVIQTGRPLVASDVRQEPRYVAGRSRTLSEIAVPISLNGEPIGALNLESDTLAAFSEADVETLAFFADASAISIAHAMLHRELIDKRRMQHQLHIAQEVQARLLPDGPPEIEGYDIAGLSIASLTIGGDYFDYMQISPDDLGVVVADVSGKGIPAALIMATFRALFRTHAAGGDGFVRGVQEVNRHLVEATETQAFVTSVYGVLHRPTGRLTYTNCGHNPPLLVSSGGDIVSLDSGGPPMGIFEEVKFEAGEVTLGPGDSLVLYTDGIVETANPRGDIFGIERLSDLVRRERHIDAQALIDEVVKATRRFSRSDAHQDDFTMVVLKRH
jgi:phosphoserine phosphatase RsbU/P